MLKREDYLEPACALCGLPGEDMQARPVPQGRILEKLTEYENREDWEACERHLKYWMAEADAQQDGRGRLMLHNEFMGFYRKQGKKEEAFRHADEAVRLLEKLGMEETVTAGTTWVNAGTVRVAFGQAEEGLALFEKARTNYEANLSGEDGRLGGLYNNMGLALTGCGRYSEAQNMFNMALEIMGKQPYGQMEQAITLLNKADTLETAEGPEKAEQRIAALLEQAEQLLTASDLPGNAYHAFVCEKCAPVFGRYGWFMTEAELIRQAEEIRRGKEQKS